MSDALLVEGLLGSAGAPSRGSLAASRALSVRGRPIDKQSCVATPPPKTIPRHLYLGAGYIETLPPRGDVTRSLSLTHFPRAMAPAASDLGPASAPRRGDLGRRRAGIDSLALRGRRWPSTARVRARSRWQPCLSRRDLLGSAIDPAALRGPGESTSRGRRVTSRPSRSPPRGGEWTVGSPGRRGHEEARPYRARAWAGGSVVTSRRRD